MAEDDAPTELDREAILARRRRFIALAISGMATAGCDKPLPEPQPCLSIAAPEPEPASESGPANDSETAPASQPFVEDPGAPLSEEREGSDGSEETGEAELEDDPPEPIKPAPRPCLNIAPKQPPPKKSAPRPCLLVELSGVDTGDDEHG